MANTIEAEIERNYAAFREMLDQLLPENSGRYALLRNQELEGLYESPGEAERAGYTKFKDAPYSIQLVCKKPIDLGFYSYAVSQGEPAGRSNPN